MSPAFVMWFLAMSCLAFLSVSGAPLVELNSIEVQKDPGHGSRDNKLEEAENVNYIWEGKKEGNEQSERENAFAENDQHASSQATAIVQRKRTVIKRASRVEGRCHLLLMRCRKESQPREQKNESDSRSGGSSKQPESGP